MFDSAGGVQNDPNKVIWPSGTTPRKYRGIDCLKCPGGSSNTPAPAGSCPSAFYNYLSSPKATTWLYAINSIQNGMDDRLVHNYTDHIWGKTQFKIAISPCSYFFLCNHGYIKPGCLVVEQEGLNYIIV